MSKFYLMGNYTAQAFQGFLKDPNSDRSKAAQAAAGAVGAKFISYDALRGSFDFIAVVEGSFEQCAGVKIATEASGALKNINIFEAIKLSGPATEAVKIAAKYKAPGQ
jgi:uncharacterized protein with GYD domain